MGLTTKQRYFLRGKSKERVGIFEDKAKYFSCLNCGFVCNNERDITTNAAAVRPFGRLATEDGHGVKTEGIWSGELNGFDIQLENPSADVQLGCPFCGVAWKK